MNRIELRIGADGCVRGLWNDEIDWSAIGHVHVERASHVEFDEQRQAWVVLAGQKCNALRIWLGRVVGRPPRGVLHQAATRSAALAWEEEYFGPGGAGWTAMSDRRSHD